MQNYPVKFDLVYGFECAANLSNVLALKDDIARCINGTKAETRGYKMDDVLRTFQFYHNYVDVKDDPKTNPPTRGLSAFIKEMGIVEADFVVLKMDVEGMEYHLLESIMGDGIYRLLDEVGYLLGLTRAWKKLFHGPISS
jgi:hypothetical protein